MDERHYLIGTAGHVDHGKTELIRALTGIETDRLKEEKLRGISIELGFAHMILPSGRRVGIVDVPGHERFVRQMLAGASGMDVVLLVIAADEGIMPQTREHLNILTLLGVSKGIVVLNKIDLVDQEWQELIEEEIKEDLRGTAFAEVPIIKVSAVNKEGIPDLLKVIEKVLDEADSKQANGPVRMPVDRVFSVQGFGTVVTGTLHSGQVQLGQELIIEPGHLLTRVRSLQVHGEKVESAAAGQRVAINLAGIDVGEVEKGAVLVKTKAFKVGNILDLKLQNLPSTEKAIEQRQRVRFHLGTTEILGRVHLLDREELIPGDECYAQILLEAPVLGASGDRFVLRFYSPAHTIAGGKVLGVAEYKQKRFKETVLAQMQLKDQGNPLDLIERESLEPHTLAELDSIFHLGTVDLKSWLHELIENGRLEVWNSDGEELYWATDAIAQWRASIAETLKSYQKAYPLRGGLGREELKAKMGIAWNHRRWQIILDEGSIRGYYRLNGSKVQGLEEIEWPAQIAQRLKCLRQKWANIGLMPPDLETTAQECGVAKNDTPEYALYLCDQGEWVNVSGFYFNKNDLEAAKERIVNFLDKNKEVSVAEVRELWGTSRKYAVPLLEYFDQLKITRRQGDKRVRF